MMKQADQVKVIKAIENLSSTLNKYHGNSQTAQYVQETLNELRKEDEKAFTGTFEYFIVKASMLRHDENIDLNEEEIARFWDVSSLKDLVMIYSLEWVLAGNLRLKFASRSKKN